MAGPLFRLSPSSQPDPVAPVPPKLGGDPDAPGPLAWPACAQCGTPMRFLFQLPHLPGTLDLAPFTSVHVFRCENPQTVCDGFSATSGANRAVGVKAGPGGLTGAPDARVPYLEQYLAFSPATENTPALSIDKDTATLAALGEYDRAVRAAPSSKLGGVPLWPQGDVTPTCCGQRMEFVAQLHGETFGIPFGDDGIGFLFRCAKRCENPFKFLSESY